MGKLISKKFIIIYLVIFFVFQYAFSLTTDFYIKDCITTPHPIDVHPYEAKILFDAPYVVDAKHKGYDHSAYYSSFFLLDLVFPLLYSFLFLSIIEVVKGRKIYTLFFFLIIAGGVFDYLENISFASFLSLSNDNLAAWVAFFSSVKVIFFAGNIIIAAALLAWIIFSFLKKLFR